MKQEKTVNQIQQVVFRCISALALVFGGFSALAQDGFPDRPITITIAVGPGGGVDVTTRALAKVLSDMWRQPVVVQNRPGANGIIAAMMVSRSPPDGSHLYLAHNGDISSTPFVLNRPDYQPLKQLTPISQILTQPYVLSVHPSVPAKDVAQLIAWIKKKNATGEKVNAISASIGGTEHLSAEQFRLAAGLEDLQIVPYKSAAPALMDVTAGHVPFGFFSLGTAGGQLKAGAVRALAISSKQRLDIMPDLPTVAEVLPGFASYAWMGMFGPAEMPKELAERISRDIHKAADSPAMRTLMNGNGQAVALSTPSEFAKFLRQDAEQTSATLKNAGIKPQ
jgi:tripartite-type tricarboxylate transporter receptor subunit TctC